MAITISNRTFPLLLLISLLGLCCLTKASVMLIGKNGTLSFNDVEANFAPAVKESGICGELHLAEPLNACTDLTNVVEQGENCTAPFVVIIRGRCSFEDKVRRAQKAGFKAAIVFDNEDGGFLVAMAGNSAGIKIPAVFVSKESGETLKKFAGFPGMELWIIPNFENSAWSIMAISFISLLAMSAVLGTCFFVRRHRVRRGRPRADRVREFHGMSKRLVKAMPSLIFTSVLEDNSTSCTCAICLEDYNVGEKLRILPCRHKFHAFCVDAWLTAWRTFCPVCKRDARTSTGIPPASESTPLLSSSQASVDSSYLLSSFRSSLHSTSTIQIPPASASFRSFSRGHSLASSPAGQQSFRSYRHSPPININRSYADLRNASSQRSFASHLASSHSMGYPSISPINSRYISPYASPSIVGSSSRRHHPVHYSESAASFSSFASGNSSPEC